MHISKIILIILLFIINNNIFSQWNNRIVVKVKVIQTDVATIDSNTLFEVIIKNRSRKKLTVPTNNYEEKYFGTYKSFFNTFIYKNETNKIDSIGIYRDSRLIHRVPFELVDSIDGNQLINIKKGETINYKLKLLKGFSLPKGSYYFRTQFSPPINISENRNLFYEAHFLKFEFVVD